MNNNGRSTTIDFMRLIFAIAIVIFHGKQVFDVPVFGGCLFVRGAYGVDFFFIVSGYLITSYINLCNRKYKEEISMNKLCTETLLYVVARIKKILPYHLLAFFLSFRL